FYHPIVVARAADATLYSDDFSLRERAKGMSGIKGFSTQAFLRRCQQLGIISSDAYEDCVIKLIQARYYFVSDSPQTLLRAFVLNGFKVEGFAKDLLQRVFTPEVERGGAFRLLGGLLALLLMRAPSSFMLFESEFSQMMRNGLIQLSPKEV